MVKAVQIRAARALISWTQADLAERTGIPERTVRRTESGGDPKFSVLERITSAFVDNNVEFISAGATSNRGARGLRLRNKTDRQNGETLVLSGLEIRAARILLNWPKETLASNAQISVETLKKVEAGYSSGPRTSKKICDAIVAGGIAVLGPGEVSPDGGIGVRYIVDGTPKSADDAI